MTPINSTQLIARNLQLSYQRRTLWALPEIKWQQGQSIWLQGRNGSGKTSLMKILAGLQQPSRGQVIWQNLEQQSALPCCYLHQQPFMFNTSVRGNLKLVLQGQKLSPSQVQERLAAALNWAGLDALAQQPARTLSGGERQRLALARARLAQPVFWLLDEPTANLDTQAIVEVAALLKDLQQEGKGLLITSHQSNAVTDLCEQQWRLEQGELNFLSAEAIQNV